MRRWQIIWLLCLTWMYLSLWAGDFLSYISMLNIRNVLWYRHMGFYVRLFDWHGSSCRENGTDCWHHGSCIICSEQTYHSRGGKQWPREMKFSHYYLQYDTQADNSCWEVLTLLPTVRYTSQVQGCSMKMIRWSRVCVRLSRLWMVGRYLRYIHDINIELKVVGFRWCGRPARADRICTCLRYIIARQDRCFELWLLFKVEGNFLR